MAGLEDYRKIVKELLVEYAQYAPANSEIEMETIFDELQDRYELVALGWQGKRRVHGSVIHIDIKDDKVWLQHDSTDAEIARILVEKGIPAGHIVLGFQPRHYRRHTDYAVA